RLPKSGIPAATPRLPLPDGRGNGKGEGDSPNGGQGGLNTFAAQRPPLPTPLPSWSPHGIGDRGEQKPTTAGSGATANSEPSAIRRARRTVLRAAGAPVAASDPGRRVIGGGRPYVDCVYLRMNCCAA